MQRSLDMPCGIMAPASLLCVARVCLRLPLEGGDEALRLDVPCTKRLRSEPTNI